MGAQISTHSTMSILLYVKPSFKVLLALMKTQANYRSKALHPPLQIYMLFKLIYHDIHHANV